MSLRKTRVQPQGLFGFGSLSLQAFRGRIEILPVEQAMDPRQLRADEGELGVDFRRPSVKRLRRREVRPLVAGPQQVLPALEVEPIRVGARAMAPLSSSERDVARAVAIVWAMSLCTSKASVTSRS
jgi:hypothetical protein